MPKRCHIIQARLKEANEKGLVMPNGSGRHPRFFLTNKEQISARINNTPVR